MTIQIWKALREHMERALTEPLGDENPFVREGDKTFMRYDEVQISMDVPYKVIVAYLWRGVVAYTVDYRLDAPQVLRLTGISGKEHVQMVTT